jgi:hypothetical protein
MITQLGSLQMKVLDIDHSQLLGGSRYSDNRFSDSLQCLQS